jgi:hypothetical protein
MIMHESLGGQVERGKHRRRSPIGSDINIQLRPSQTPHPLLHTLKILMFFVAQSTCDPPKKPRPALVTNTPRSSVDGELINCAELRVDVGRNKGTQINFLWRWLVSISTKAVHHVDNESHDDFKASLIIRLNQ